MKQKWDPCDKSWHQLVLNSSFYFFSDMITDVQLAAFANILGVSLFLLVVLYHFVAVNNPKRKEE